MVMLNPKFIVIHHSVTDGSYQTGLNIIKRQGETFGKDSVKNCYHYMISKEGHIIAWKPENLVIGHCGVDGDYKWDKPCNFNSFGICFLGNFEIDEVSEKQYQTGLVLIKALVEKYNIKDIYGHKDVINTECPGKNLYKLIPKIKKEVFMDWKQDVFNEAVKRGWHNAVDRTPNTPIDFGTLDAILLNLVDWLMDNGYIKVISQDEEKKRAEDIGQTIAQTFINEIKKNFMKGI